MDEQKRAHCTCCGGTGRVLDMLGQVRPCSRCCDFQAWQAWAAEHCRSETANKLQSPPGETIRSAEGGAREPTR